jgi:hypothetical protein
MDLEEEAYNIIRRHKDGVFQNVIWKELDIDSRKCSRIIKKLLDKDLIIREVGVSNGARTYLLKAKEEVKEKYFCSPGICFQPAQAVQGTASPSTAEDSANGSETLWWKKLRKPEKSKKPKIWM